MTTITIEHVIDKVRTYIKDPDEKLLLRAYEFAKDAHQGQMRKSGEPFINHPLNAALILTELHQDCTVIAASFLHDTIEDQDVSPEVLQKEFGKDIAALVDGITKLSKFSFSTKEEHQAENLRKMFIAMAKDVRVVLIKLADRLHNMRTLQYLTKEQQTYISLETREIYAPLAHRLGIGSIKWELEDLSFRYLEEEAFQEIKEKVAEKRKDREKYLTDFIKELKRILKENNIEAEVQGRPKHFYSIYRKMKSQRLSFESIYDLLAIRILVNEVKDCYEVLGLVHSSWKPIQHKFGDYIAMPKSNMYQSLHTGVIGPKGKPVEIQIRTTEMHTVAEQGIAAHWSYKEGASVAEKSVVEKFAWLRQLLDWQKENAQSFMENLKVDLFVDEVFVFTPKGGVFNLPHDATPVDFAFHVHSQVGLRCMGAKVNGKMEPLDYKLNNGDIIEILTAKNDKPSLDWLNFVTTSSARNKIKNWFHRQQNEEKLKIGRETLENALHGQLVSLEALTEENLKKVVKKLKIKNIEMLYMSIGHGELSAITIAKQLKEIGEPNKEPEPSVEKSGTGTIQSASLSDKNLEDRKQSNINKSINIEGVRDILTRLAKCCTPLPGDEIVGVITKGHGISIHRASCPNVLNRPEVQTINVNWEQSTHAKYPVEIVVKAFDRMGIVKDILNQIAETKTNLREASAKKTPNGIVIANLVVEINDLKHLAEVMNKIRNNVSDVLDVLRPKPL